MTTELSRCISLGQTNLALIEETYINIRLRGSWLLEPCFGKEETAYQLNEWTGDHPISELETITKYLRVHRIHSIESIFVYTEFISNYAKSHHTDW